MRESIVRDSHFKAVAEVRVDSKKRIALPKSMHSAAAPIYVVSINNSGQLILDPQVIIPAAEAWLYKNKEALNAVRKGLKEAKEGKLLKGKRFAKHAGDKI